ncbi:uncharacterized protein LOC131854503 [Achroia grisella]|uniref:uncharacterized protein LOC131854503 n=1 Tax=Achroia grisella TaxID=688607 RepID=UPI0027D21885|nr:uncharacterized protein LOC131854503 [Achroia grisella]
MGAIGWKTPIDTWIFKCGSSLISPKFVLTAAHCTKASPRDTSIADIDPKIVRFGTKNIFLDNEVSSLKADVSISRVIIHPKYKPPKKYYDIALMELETEVQFNKMVQPACLWHKPDDSFGNLASVTGWGILKAGARNTSAELQAGDVNIINSTSCGELLKSSSNRHWDGIKDHQLCAGKPQGGVDACQGDSGGPLQVQIPLPKTFTAREGSMYNIIGVTSFGVGCALPNLPGVYTRVSSFIDWIENIVWISVKRKKTRCTENIYSEITMKTIQNSISGFEGTVLYCLCVIDILLKISVAVIQIIQAAKVTVSRRRDGWDWSHIDSLDTTPTTAVNQRLLAPTTTTTTATTTAAPCHEPPGVQPNFHTSGRRISTIKCYEYIWQLKDRVDKADKYKRCVAHRRPSLGNRHVIGGRGTKPGEFPHMGAIGWRGVTEKWLFNCGSTLISPNFVLTAGHCTKASPRDTRIADIVPKIIRFGAKNLKYPRGTTDTNISRIIPHPQYKPPKQYYDIALMEIKSPVDFSKVIQPACLWSRNQESFGTKATVTGWGVYRNGNRNTSDELQAGDINIIDSNNCNRLLKSSSNRLWDGLLDNQFCAGKLEGGIDACQGDSGGPLQVKIPLPEPYNKREATVHYVIGITSFGIGCAQPNLPGVYTRVSSFTDWVENIVWN